MSDIAQKLRILQDLIDALNAGSKPSPPLKGGPSLQIEPLDVTYHVRQIRAAVKKGCPKCGHEGKFIRMALCCPEHGAFGGC